MSTANTGHGRLVLYIDASEASQRVRYALEQTGVEFEVVHGVASPFYPLPSIQGPFGVVHGYNDIRRYLLSQLEEISQGA